MKKLKNKGQTSTEYMAMIGVSLLIIMVLLIVVHYMMSISKEQMKVNTAVQAVDKLKVAADFVYVHGCPTRTTIYINIPMGVSEGDSYINGKTINLALTVGDSHNDIYAVTKGEVNGTMPHTEGYYVMVVERMDCTEPTIKIYKKT